MPVLAVHNPATPCRCLRLGAAGWRRACGGGKAIKRAAERGGGCELRATAAPLPQPCPPAVVEAAGWSAAHDLLCLTVGIPACTFLRATKLSSCL